MWGPYFFVLALMIALVLLTGDEPEPVAEGTRAARIAPVPQIARRVEEIRSVRFRDVPEPETVSAQRARDEGLEALDEEYPAAERRRDEAVMRLLGLVPEAVDLEEVYSRIYETQVGGYNDPVRKRLRVVEGAAMASQANAETILAHELVHALEDQAFELRLEDVSGLDDRALAYTAFVEGTATVVMFEYGERHFSSEAILLGALGTALPR